ncbi:MAG: hypothetical protein Q9N67_05280 [Ghiorsea sp.]|nr:hypothetical protein [Ghiorsea sp.]
MDRRILVKLHLIMAAVALPLLLMFAITGGLYTLEYKPNLEKKEYRVTMNTPLNGDVEQMKNIVRQVLSEHDLNEPMGKVKVKRSGRHYKMKWSGKNHSVSLRASSRDNRVAVIEVKIPSSYHRLMSLHKGKGGDLFDAFAIAMSIFVVFILLTGVWIGLKTATYKALTVKALGVGSLLFLAMVIYAQF